MVSNGYILLAGGDAPRRQALRRVYSPRYGILEADDGRTALDLLTGEAPGLRGAFLGLDTPGLDGCGVLAGLARRGLARRLPVFILDSGAEPPCWTRCWKLGAADILRDPEAEPARSRTETVLALSRRPPAPQGEDSGEGSWPPAAATAAQAHLRGPGSPGCGVRRPMCAGGGRRRGTPAHPGSPMSGVWPD